MGIVGYWKFSIPLTLCNHTQSTYKSTSQTSNFPLFSLSPTILFNPTIPNGLLITISQNLTPTNQLAHHVTKDARYASHNFEPGQIIASFLFCVIFDSNFSADWEESIMLQSELAAFSIEGCGWGITKMLETIGD